MAGEAEARQAGDAAFSAATFTHRAARLLLREPPADAFDPALMPARGDHQLAPHSAPERDSLHRPAAVLVPVVARADEATVLLTRRAAGLRDHSGQIAFPGGKIDAADASPLATALREAHEEIGLDRRFVSPLGYLDAYETSTGFRVLPVIAVIDPGYELFLNASEVDAAFEVPLAFLMSAGNHQRHAREWQGSLRHYYAMPYANHYIWGATAGIIRNLYERLYAE
jgi:8-oxo-dGTP pyrophosphatase MutT (NUDIX family)